MALLYLSLDLPNQLHSKLDLPGRGDRWRLDAGICRNRLALTVEDVRHLEAEVWPVQQVEEFRPELQLEFFAQSVILEQRKIDVFHAGTSQRVAAEITDRAGGRKREALQLDIPFRMSRVHCIWRRAVGTWLEIRTLLRGCARAGTGIVRLEPNAERSAVLGCKDAAHLPS